MDISSLEIQLLALRDAAGAALMELERLKASSAPRPGNKRKDRVAHHLDMLNTGKWQKKNKKQA